MRDDGLESGINNPDVERCRGTAGIKPSARIKRFAAVCVWCVLPALLAPAVCAESEDDMQSSISFGTAAFIGWREHNKECIVPQTAQQGNFVSQIGGSFFLEGSSPFIASYYANLSLSVPLHSPPDASVQYAVLFEKIYFKSRITDFLYLTAGKTEFDLFRRFRKPVGLAALEFLIGDSWAVTLLPYFVEVRDWKDVSFACGVSGDIQNWAVNAQVYWEKQRNWMGAVQVQYVKDFFTGTLSGTVKQLPDNRYFFRSGSGAWSGVPDRRGGEATSGGKKLLTLCGEAAAEAVFTFEPLTVSAGYEFYSEGYTASEAEAFIQAVSAQPDFAARYREDFFDPHVLRAALSLHDTVVPNVTVQADYRLGLPLVGIQAVHRIDYALNRYVTVNLIHELRWSKAGGGYRLFSPFRNRLQAGCMLHL
ncbi:MAG: hypothetical protein P1P65_08935 [Treponema sp.]